MNRTDCRPPTARARMAAIAALALVAPLLARGDDAAYRESVEGFRRDRADRLTAEDGWLSVAGLAWLRPGEAALGSGPAADVPLPASAPPKVGVIALAADGSASFRPEPGVAVLRDGRPFEGGPIRSDAGGAKADVLAVGPIRLILLKRGDRYALRIKDNESPLRRDFAGLRWFPVDESWRVDARFTPHPIPARIAFDSIVGHVESIDSPGYATFERDGKSYRLDAAVEGEKLWFVFRDATAGRTTAANARQLLADPPIDGQITLDFNLAINLPCAYTPHATCPIPPPQNRLDLAIPAGEKTYDPNPRSAFGP